MRLLFCAWHDTAHPRAGGSEVLVDRLASGLTERGHDVTVLCAGPVGDHPYAVVANGSRLSQFVRAPIAARRLGPEPDLLVDVANGTGFYPALWSRRPRLCIVNHVHTDQWDDWFPAPLAAIGRGLESNLLPWANRKNPVVAVSPSTAAGLIDLGVDPHTVTVIHNGVDAVPHVAPLSTEPLFLAVGRLVPHKRYDLLVRLWEQVRPATGGRLIIIGDGPEEERIRALGGNGVEVVGAVDDATHDRLYDEAWALLHPALVEGWGLVIAEAAAGTPAIGFDVAGVRDAIVDGETGLLATDERQFVARWTAVGTDPGLRRRLGAAARARSQDFPWERTVDEFESLALATVARRPQRRSPRVGSTTHAAIPAYDGWRPSITDRAMAAAADRLAVGNPPPLSRRNILRLFLREKHDPAPFYRALAERTVRGLPHDLDGARVLDLGCGPGTYSLELRRAGAIVTGVDQRGEETASPSGDEPGPDLIADAARLPLPAATFDGVFCSNLLEHTPDVGPVFDEIARLLRPGGWAWVSFTNWYSPWGGHEITPLHLLGPRVGLAAHRRLFGEPRKNVPYDELWPTHVGATMRAVEHRADLRTVAVEPRYYPRQRWITRVPGLREVATWNCLFHLERLAEDPATARRSAAVR